MSLPPSLPLPLPLAPAVFVRRVNRFAATVRLAGAGRSLRVHLPNSGRMTELLLPGTPAWVHLVKRRRARTRGTLLLLRHHGRWVGVDAGMPNRLVELALRSGGLGPITHVTEWRREVRWAGGRLDFTVETAEGRWLLETKSCNKVVAGTALFPDAPTARGVRHLRELARAAARGQRAAVVWVVQRSDAHRLGPDAAADPGFADAVERAARAGVRLLAYTCRVSARRIALGREIPVKAGGGRGRILAPRWRRSTPSGTRRGAPPS